jgi:hypothetical protein
MLKIHTWMQLSIDFNQYFFMLVKECSMRTEDLVAHIVLPDEVAKELLVYAGCIDNLASGSVHVHTI